MKEVNQRGKGRRSGAPIGWYFSLHSMKQKQLPIVWSQGRWTVVMLWCFR